MHRIISVTVLGILEENRGVQWLATDGGCGRAVLYTSLYQKVKPGDRVKVNVTAGMLGLGTGGADFVCSIEREGESAEGTPEGHIMKCRYLPVQQSMLTVESPENHDAAGLYQEELHLGGKRILLCELHSMLPVVWRLYRDLKPGGRLVAIIDDQAALALPFSRILGRLHGEEDFISITAGQAFGGKYEAVNVLTAMQYAADTYPDALIVITVGPGVAGTGTRYGYSGIVQASWANLIGKKGGIPVWAPRLSQADRRNRHYGLSHHTITALTELTYADSVLPLPAGEETWRHIDCEAVEKMKRHPWIEVPEIEESRVMRWITAVLGGENVTTMGRGIKEDLLFFTGVGTAVYWLNP
ncbi:DUF3866 family protein [Alteribacter natronophilus]|uniref:DUF3866 family protein n=1 Tax=Alteribacter natronophilus TaxID=2583810 RepID=UPI00110D4BCF|nr:DUF3866 family protein [Alteribacter natronophilus]TMW73688.1 DUF3866 family protein [Alteribacter natronophilus]